MEGFKMFIEVGKFVIYLFQFVILQFWNKFNFIIEMREIKCCCN